MLKVKVTCGWTDNQELKKRIIGQFGDTLTMSDLEIVSEGNEYDLMVAFNYVTEQPIDNRPIFLFPQEPTWSGAHQKNFESMSNIKIFGFDKKNYNPQENVIETLAHMFYGGRGPWEEGYDFWTFNNLTNLEIHKNKNICSFISNRGIDDKEFPLNCLYKERVELVLKCSEYLPFIDFYGWGDTKNLKPHSPNKGLTIKNYKFCLTIENSYEKNYLSEKFYDCILTDTIPIYYGCSNILDYWDNKGFILLESITDYDYLIKKLLWINENIDTLYEEMLPELLNMKKKYFNNFNLLKKIKKEYYSKFF
jgi:hypothetical protein